MKNLQYIFLVLLLAALAACGKKAETTTETEATGPVVIHLTDEQKRVAGIQTGAPGRKLLSTPIECTGKVEVPPQSLATVYAPVAGFVKVVKYLPGDYVKKGDLLITLSHPDLIKLQREWLETKSRLNFLEQENKRKQTLAGADAASRRAAEEAATEYEVAKTHYMGLKVELELIGLPVAQIEKSGIPQSVLHLYAPVAGYITRIDANLGKLVNSHDLLYEIVDNSHLHLELQVFAKDLAYLKPGQKITATVPGTDKSLEAEVHLVGKMIDDNTKTTMVHGHFLIEPVPLTPGTMVQASIQANPVEAWALPTGALVRAGDQSYVFIQSADGFEKKAVKTGRTQGDWTEVFDLDDKTVVVLEGAYYLNNMEGEAGHSH